MAVGGQPTVPPPKRKMANEGVGGRSSVAPVTRVRAMSRTVLGEASLTQRWRMKGGALALTAAARRLH